MRAMTLAGALIAGVILVSGCATSTPVEKAPLAPQKQEELRKRLIGTWEHTHTLAEEGADKEPMTGAKITWTFREDGTGTFRQRVESIDIDKTSDFNWKLEGRNLVLHNQEGEQGTPYRIDNWTDGRMKWFNYTMSNYYLVARTD